MKIVSVGEITYDYYIPLNRHYVGGISLNFAVHAKRCGVQEVMLISRVGQDEAADKVRQHLQREGINTTYVASLPGETASIDIDFREDGDRYFPAGSYQARVLENMTLSPAELAACANSDLTMTSYNEEAFGHVFEALTNLPRQGKLAADFGDSAYYEDKDTLLSWMQRVDLAFISGTPADLAWLSADNVQLVLTCGAQGSYAITSSEPVYQPAVPITKLVDPTGCGDSFQAAFAVSFLQHDDLGKALLAGATLAAQTLTHYGAT